MPNTIIQVILLKKKIVYNAGVLAASNIVVRILGLLYRIWLSRAITNVSLGLFQLSMSVYMLLITPISSGLPNAVSVLSAYRSTKEGDAAANSVLRSGLRIATAIALPIGAIMLVGAQLLSGILLHDIKGDIIIIALIPAVVLGGIASVPSAFLHSKQRSIVPAISEVIEQVCKIGFGVGIILLLNSKNNYINAAAAAAALSFGGIVSFFILRYSCGYKKNAIYKPQTKYLIKAAVPLTGSRALGALIQLAVTSLLPIQLMLSGLTKDAALSQFGILTGMAMPIIFLPTTFTSALCVVLLPDIAKCRASGNYRLIKSKINRSLLFTAVITAIAAICIAFIARPMGGLVYKQPLAGNYILALSPLVFIMGLTQVSGTILNSLKQEKKMLLYNLIGGVVCLVLMYVLTPISGLGLMGYIIATTIQSILICILNLFGINKTLKSNNK